MPDVVIVGAGFAGLNAARGLARRRVPGARIILIDRRNHHLFQPLLYQVALGGLSPAEIAYPVRSAFADMGGVEVLLGRVDGVDLAAHRVHGDFGVRAFDYLILACGARHSYFAHPEWEEFAPGLKTLEHAIEIRRRVFLSFELAERAADEAERDRRLTFVIVGGGPTGVELAGSLAEIAHRTLARDFRRIDTRRAKIVLLEAGPRILPAFDAALAARAARDLADLGVTVRTGARVARMDAAGLDLDGGEHLPLGVAIWAAGVAPAELNRNLGAPLDRLGRAMVGPDLSLPGHPNVFVLGDQARAVDASGSPLPGLAPVAVQQGRFVAKLIAREAARPGAPRPAFRYVDKGTMATIGRRRAVAKVGSARVTGAPAWLLWLAIHIYFLIGFRNRFFVLCQWAYAYLTFRRGARLITGPDWRDRANS